LAHDQLSSGRMGHLRVREKLAVTRRNSPDLNRKPTVLRDGRAVPIEGPR
jgi:hypothetical protein